MIRNQKGFTLVEIAIVLVIIGLLIGGVLKGQTMIQNAKVKRIAKSVDELRAAVYTFYDKFGVYPGDENKPIPAGDTRNGNGSGRIDTTAEYPMVFQDLALARIISGNFNGTSGNYPKHAFGDDYFIQWIAPTGGRADHYIRFDYLPWDVALELDTKYDDGVYNTGDIRANEDYRESTSPVSYLYIPL
jgi:prepilin-type N-terminal cleavage/methylation domain-containing protein